MSRWSSAMPMDYGVKSHTHPTPRGPLDMPDGVFPLLHVAQSVAADLKRARSSFWAAHQRTGVVVTVAGTVVPEGEIRERTRLLAGARRGDKAAAAELWKTRRAWIIRGPRKGGDPEGQPAADMAPGCGARGGPAASHVGAREVMGC